MENRPWLNSLRVELARQGLPARHIDRLMEELADHRSDFMEENEMDTENDCLEACETRLGRPEEVAEAAVANYRRARFVGRHPWLTFLVAPIPTVVLTWTVSFLTILAFFYLLPSVLGDAYNVEGKTADQWPPVLLSAVWGLHYAGKFLPSAVVAVLFCYLARRSGRKLRWALLACGLVAVFSFGFNSSLLLPETPGGHGQYTVGLGISPDTLRLEWIYVVQFAVPLLIGLLFVLRNQWRRGPLMAG
ncbi:MAG: hypothetical protein JW888_10635 [Pirellulales bacterium]|nr:hypothetical protein [Pirellulales bacterium]